MSLGGEMIFRKAGPGLIALALLSLSLKAASADEMNQIIKNIRVVFEDYYAPKQWKSDSFAWDLEDELTKLSAASNSGDRDGFHQSLADFFKATRDYHTGILFASNTVATLPLSVKYIDGKYYVAYLPPSLMTNFGLKLGDEITHMNDVSVNDLAYQLMGKLDEPSLTDWSLAARKLTRRSSAALDKIERGSVVIKGLRGNKTVVAQVVWDVNAGVNNANVVKSQRVRINQFFANSPLLHIAPKQRAVLENVYRHIDNRSFRIKFADVFNQIPAIGAARDPLAFGKKESYLPVLGDRIIWRTDATNPWEAYVYMNEDNKLVGFIRLPSYVPDENVGDAPFYAEKFGEIVAKVNDIADVLVIDQLNNPGGSVFYLYTLASMLTDKPLVTPRHQFTIDSRDVWEAKEFLKQVDALIALASQLPGPVAQLEGYPLDLQFLTHLKSYYQFVVDQWNQGKTLTDPYFLYGVDYIQPNAKYRFTKKVLLLTNEFDFSGGDFFPAIMQDNGRAVVMGTNTSGAGGYVLQNTDRNRAGIVYYSYTGSIAIRPNGKPLENLGVTPDIMYQISPIDLASGYLVFKESINAVVNELLK